MFDARIATMRPIMMLSRPRSDCVKAASQAIIAYTKKTRPTSQQYRRADSHAPIQEIRD
jgi:hypothetical protein